MQRFPKTRLTLFFGLALAIIVADQVTKQLVVGHLPVESSVEVFPGYFDIVHARNPGAAFGVFSESGPQFRSYVLLSVTIAALLVILGAMLCTTNIDASLTAGYSLFFGGAAGNLIDRIRFGEVVDFLDVHVGAYHWPAFNVADSALCVGVGLFFLHAFRERRKF